MPAIVLLVLPLAAIAWVTLLVAAPFAAAAVATPVYMFGSVICHQISERSFYIDGLQLPVCARCFGIYAGAAAAAASAMLAGRTWSGAPGERDWVRRTLVIAAIPTAVTVLLEWAGVWHPGNAMRALAGAVLGGGVALVVMRAIHYERWQRRRPLDRPPRPTPI